MTTLKRVTSIVNAVFLVSAAAIALAQPKGATFALTGQLMAQSVPPSAARPQTIVFVCPFGSAKSVVAARFFNRMATERGLPYRGGARGLTPEATIPPYVRDPIRADGFEIGAAEKPVRLEAAEVTSAAAVVCIMCELPPELSAIARESMRWTDVPDVDAGYEPARDKILAHLTELLAKLRPF